MKRFLSYAERALNGEVYIKIIYQENSELLREEFKTSNATAQQNALKNLFLSQGVDPTLQGELNSQRRGTQQ
jgi:hypothetical protein